MGKLWKVITSMSPIQIFDNLYWNKPVLGTIYIEYLPPHDMEAVYAYWEKGEIVPFHFVEPATDSSGTIWLSKDFNVHREAAPAIIWSRGKIAYVSFGKFHRTNGPAIIYPNGAASWHINGDDITVCLYSWASEMNINLNNLSEDEECLIAMKWSEKTT